MGPGTHNVPSLEDEWDPEARDALYSSKSRGDQDFERGRTDAFGGQWNAYAPEAVTRLYVAVAVFLTTLLHFASAHAKKIGDRAVNADGLPGVVARAVRDAWLTRAQPVCSRLIAALSAYIQTGRQHAGALLEKARPFCSTVYLRARPTIDRCWRQVESIARLAGLRARGYAHRLAETKQVQIVREKGAQALPRFQNAIRRELSQPGYHPKKKPLLSLTAMVGSLLVLVNLLPYFYHQVHHDRVEVDPRWRHSHLDAHSHLVKSDPQRPRPARARDHAASSHDHGASVHDTAAARDRLSAPDQHVSSHEQRMSAAGHGHERSSAGLDGGSMLGSLSVHGGDKGGNEGEDEGEGEGSLGGLPLEDEGELTTSRRNFVEEPLPIDKANDIGDVGGKERREGGSGINAGHAVRTPGREAAAGGVGGARERGLARVGGATAVDKTGNILPVSESSPSGDAPPSQSQAELKRIYARLRNVVLETDKAAELQQGNQTAFAEQKQVKRKADKLLRTMRDRIHMLDAQTGAGTAGSSPEGSPLNI
eukprot:jgi/Mesvir1/16519/Mv10069-RA.1